MFDRFFRNREVATIRRWQQEKNNNQWLFTWTDLLVFGSTGAIIGILIGAILAVGAR